MRAFLRSGLFAALAMAALLAVKAAYAADAPASDNGGDISKSIINDPGTWVIMGTSQPKPRDDPSVQGGKALRIVVPGKGANPWDIAANSPVIRAVAKGDVLLVAFWARAEAPAEGDATGHLAVRLQQTSAPYTATAEAEVHPTGTWTMYYASGVAAQDSPQGSMQLTVHLAFAKQTIDLGPVFVLDFGPNYDRSKLPQNAADNGATRSQAPSAAAASWSDAQAEKAFAPELANLRKLLPVRGRLINDPSVAAIAAYGPDQTNQYIDAPDVAGGRALRVATSKTGGDPWSNGTGSQTRGDIHTGDAIFVAFYARAHEANSETQSGVISAYNVQRAASPYDVEAGTSAQVPLNQWRLFYAAGVARVDLPAGQGVISAQIGAYKQTIDFGPVFVLDLGPGVPLAGLPQNKITYAGRDAGAPWRAAAEERIRQVRTGDFKVTVTDANGQPVSGARVHFAMQKHYFHFGTFVGHNIANATGPDADKARETFLKMFNFGTSPIYWSDWGWANPTFHANYIASMKWLQDHGVAFRAHPAIYPREDLTPGYVKRHAGDQAAAEKAVLDHVRDVVPIVAQYGGCCIDVVNEPRDGTYLPSIAGPDIFAKAYTLAHQLAPNLHMFVNDYGIIEGGGVNAKNLAFYRQWIESMLAKGVPLGGIGIQGHFGADLTDPARVIAVIDDFSRYKLPLEITEFDVDTTDEAAQADYTRDMLTVAFSEPSVDAFIIWGWWDGDDWRPGSGLLRHDWSVRPNGTAWMNRIYHDWWTDATVTAGADGAAGTRAFFGDYEITVSGNGKTATRTVSFVPGAGPVTVALP